MNGSSLDNAKNTVFSSEVSVVMKMVCSPEPQANLSLSQLPTLQSDHEPILFTSSPAAQSAMDTVANHPITQNVKDTVQNGEVRRRRRPKILRQRLLNWKQNDADELNHLTPEKDRGKTYMSLIGPLGQKVKEQGAKTSSEFQDLADARRTPDQPAANGQPLTRKCIQRV
jgi:hypothetical protein